MYDCIYMYICMREHDYFSIRMYLCIYMYVCMHVCIYVCMYVLVCMYSMYVCMYVSGWNLMFGVSSSILTPFTCASIFLILLGLTDHQPNIYTSQPKYDFEWFCILMTCTQQWPRSFEF